VIGHGFFFYFARPSHDKRYPYTSFIHIHFEPPQPANAVEKPGIYAAIKGCPIVDAEHDKNT